MRRLSYLNSATPSAISAISSAATGRPYANNRAAGDMFAGAITSGFGTGPKGPWLSLDAWERRWLCDDWRTYLQDTQPESSRKAIRDSTFSGRPLGSAEFTRALEKQEQRPLIRQKPGPKKRCKPGQEQAVFSFDPF